MALRTALLRLLLGVLLGAALTGKVCAGEPCAQIWLISTRAAPRCGELDASLQSLRYWRYDETACRWSPSGSNEFDVASPDALPTVVFIHGNRTDSDEAVTKGWYAYEYIRACSACRPIRYVIWSWPAERMCRGVHEDTRLKVELSDIESYYLACWLGRARPSARISLIGHSFGPRIVTGALHLLAGGEVDGRNMPPSTVAAWSGGKRNPIRVVLLAAALDAGWLAPGGCHDRAVSLMERMLVTCNDRDRVLRWNPRMYGRGGPEAMGFVGPCGIAEADKVEVIDVACTVGRIHDWRCYCSAANVCSRWSEYTFLAD
jgi:hypothetical protein